MGEGGLLPSVKLFGVHLQSSTSSLPGDCNSNSSDIHCNGLLGMRKCVSMGNLCNFSHSTLVSNISSSEEHIWKPNRLSPSPPLMNITSVDPNANSHGYLSDGLVHSSLSSRLRERKKGVPWTEDEHRLFLMGLQKLGKGDWRGISKSFVMSRTPTQVASHAQKYFLRQSDLNKRKRRSSLFDIMSNHLPHAMTVSSSCSLDHLSQKPLASIMELNVFESSRPMAITQTNNVNVLVDHGLGFDNRLLETSVPSKQLDHSFIPEFAHNKTFTSTPIPHPSPCSLTTSSCVSSSTLYRIDETMELSGLGLSIGPPTSMDDHNSSLNMEQPRRFSTPPLMHSSSPATIMPSSNNNTSLANAMISVV